MGPRRTLILIAALALIGAGTAAIGRTDEPALSGQQHRLLEASAASRAAEARAQALEVQAMREGDTAARARTQEAAAAARIAGTQAQIAATEARLAILDRLLDHQRRRLAQRQGPILRLVAALQAMARRPMLLALAQPGSVQDMVHVRATLVAMLPAIEARSARVRAELARARALRAGATRAVAALREGRARLERQRLAALELEARHRLRATTLRQSALAESDRAIALGEAARDIAARIETQQSGAQIEAALRALPGPLPRPDTDSAAAPPRPGPPPYRLPVRGRLLTGFGALSPSGARARGLTFACAPGSAIVAPAAGRIAYAAARFRHYGGVVILDHGQGWTSLITGLATITVKPGARVAMGARLGAAPKREAPAITIELRRRGQPMDLTQLLD